MRDLELALRVERLEERVRKLEETLIESHNQQRLAHEEMLKQSSRQQVMRAPIVGEVE